MWLFESLDEVRASGFDPSKKFKRNECVLKSPDFIFYERPTPGGGLARCIFGVMFLKKSKNRDSENDGLVRSGVLRSFLGGY